MPSTCVALVYQNAHFLNGSKVALYSFPSVIHSSYTYLAYKLQSVIDCYGIIFRFTFAYHRNFLLSASNIIDKLCFHVYLATACLNRIQTNVLIAAFLQDGRSQFLQLFPLVIMVISYDI